jgi:predicted Fe-S protein YdhL (DUF1289 family)
MIGDIACLGICIVDPDTGICQGCGRGPEEISGVPVAVPDDETRKKNQAMPLSALQAPLPSQVANELGSGSD